LVQCPASIRHMEEEDMGIEGSTSGGQRHEVLLRVLEMRCPPFSVMC